VGKGSRNRAKQGRDEIAELSQPKTSGLDAAKRQLKTAAKATLIALVVVWLLALGFATGLQTMIPYMVAAVLTLVAGVGAFLVQRNLKKSESISALVSGELSDEDRAVRLAELDGRVAKGDAAAILAKAQLQMQDAPREALATLEGVDLDKAQKLIAAQVRAMRAMIHLNLGDVSDARALAEAIDLAKAPDPKSRANLAAVVAEAWARSGNPIEASELLDKYDLADPEMADVKLQLLRARVFASAHKQDLNGMRRALKQLVEVSPQLAAMFVGQKRIHPLLQQEAKRVLERSGLVPRQKIQVARR